MSYLPPVVAELTGRDDDLVAVLRRAKERVKTWCAEVERMKATVKVTVDDAQAQSRINSVRDKLRNLSDTSVRIRIDDTGAAERIRTLRDDLATLDGQNARATVSVNDVQAQRRIDSIRDRMRALQNARVKVEVDVAEALRNLALVEAALRRIDGLNRQVRLNARLTVGGGGPGRGGAGGSGGAGDIGMRIRTSLLAAMRALPAVRVTADTSPADRSLAQLREQLRVLGTARIGVDIPVEEAARQAAQIRAQLAVLAATHTDIKVRTDATHAILTLDRIQAQVNHLNGQNVDIDTKKAVKSLGLLATAALSLWPAITPLLATTTAAVMGLAASWSVAAVGAGAFAAALKPQLDTVSQASTLYATIGKRTDNLARAKQLLTQFTEGSKEHAAVQKKVQAATVSLADAELKYQRALEDMTPAQRAATEAFGSLKTKYQEWSDKLSPATLGVFTQAMNALGGVFPKLTPLVEGSARAVGTFLDKLGSGPGSAAFRQFGANAKELAGSNLLTLLTTLKNLAGGVTGVLNAFMPASQGISKGLEDMTARFADWGQHLGTSEGFAKFLSYVQESAPKVKDFLGELITFVERILSASATPGTGILGVVTTLLKLFNEIPTSVLEYIVTTVPLIVLGIKAWTAAQWLLNIATSANPLGATLTALGLIASGFLLAWQHSETFRFAVTTAFSQVSTVALWAAKVVVNSFEWLNDTVLAVVENLLRGADKALSWIPGFGDKAKQGAEAVAALRQSFSTEFDGMNAKINEWQQHVDNMPRNIQLQANIDDLTQKITDAKQQLSDKNLPSEKRAKLTADITDWQMQIAAAKMTMAETPDKKRAVLTAQIDDWMARVEQAKRQLDSAPPSKKTELLAEISDLQYKVAIAKRNLDSLHDRTITVTTSFQSRFLDAGQPRAEGGIIGPRFRDGGVLRAANGATVPGYAPRRDSVLSLLSPGEGVLVPEAVRQIGGAPAIDAINRRARYGTGLVPMEPVMTAAGGGTTVIQPILNVTVQGSVLSERDLRAVLEAQMARLGAHNSTTWAPFQRG